MHSARIALNYPLFITPLCSLAPSYVHNDAASDAIIDVQTRQHRRFLSTINPLFSLLLMFHDTSAVSLDNRKGITLGVHFLEKIHPG